MTEDRTLIVVDERLQSYNFGPEHPLSPIRIAKTYELAANAGLLDSDGVTTSIANADVTDELLQQVHDLAFINAVKQASTEVDYFHYDFGLGTADVPRFDGMHDAALLHCSATLTAAQAVASGEFTHAVNVAGGHHHAMRSKASGFGIYNDIAVAIQWLLNSGYERIAYIDVDAHHGDGVEAIFWNDPRVMTVSIHESGKTLFPGTGFSTDVGGPDAIGFAVNLPMPSGVQDSQWLRAFTAVVPDLMREFAPQIIVSQHGSDSHREDPLTHMELSQDAMRYSYEMIHELAHEFCGGKWISVGGGGYTIETTVPQMWTHLIAIASHHPQFVTYSDGQSPTWKSFESGWDPESEIDRSVIATRKAVFPHHGLPADPTAAY